MLVTAAVTGYHWYSGASFESALRMMTEDYRLAVACPTEMEAVLGFVHRSPSPGGYSPMSVRYGDDWVMQVCNGDIANDQSTDLAKVAQPTQVGAPVATGVPVPSTEATVGAKIQSTVEAPVRPSVATPHSDAAQPILSSANTPTPSPVATVVPTITPTHIPAPVLRPNLRHIKEKSYMLELINAERVQAGLKPVVLGNNVAAQLHAEASLKNCFSSHWGLDGLKPYMRYSLAGGYQSNGENGLGSDYCITASDRYRPISSVHQEIREAMGWWMDSSGHRDNILRPWHKKVNIGLAWDRYNFKAIQHFEGDYVEYDQMPTIEGGILSLSGGVKNGVIFEEGRDLGVQVYYDSPPHSLTRGQVARTYCYDLGLKIAALRAPLTGNWFYDEDAFRATYKPCPNPYDVPADADAPRSHDDAYVFWQAAYDASQTRQEKSITLPWITALEWTARGEVFSVTADLRDLLAKHGKGVYSLIVWGSIGSEDVIISQYSTFHDVAPPDTYNADNPEGE